MQFWKTRLYTIVVVSPAPLGRPSYLALGCLHPFIVAEARGAVGDLLPPITGGPEGHVFGKKRYQAVFVFVPAVRHSIGKGASAMAVMQRSS